jgi:large repetitive protein
MLSFCHYHLVRRCILSLFAHRIAIFILVAPLLLSAQLSVAADKRVRALHIIGTSPQNTSPSLTVRLPEPLTFVRHAHSATRLRNGTVLIVGGTPFFAPDVSAELFDPTTAHFTLTGQLLTNRSNHTASLLPDGEVLVTGGTSDGLSVLASTERYNPITKLFRLSAAMHTGRQGHTATLLSNGLVLIVGGFAPHDTFTETGNLTFGRGAHTATLLHNGQVLITGGEGGKLRPDGGIDVFAMNQAEVYDPPTGTFRLVGIMVTYRDRHTATLLADGRVLLTGGIDWAHQRFLLTTAEIYDPVTETFHAVGAMRHGRQDHTATLLPSGRRSVRSGHRTVCGHTVPNAEPRLSSSHRFDEW